MVPILQTVNRIGRGSARENGVGSTDLAAWGLSSDDSGPHAVLVLSVATETIGRDGATTTISGDPPKVTPGERLKIARREAGFGSARSAAIAMDISVYTYSGHENGNRSISQAFANRYAHRFGVRAAWLMFGDGSPHPDPVDRRAVRTDRSAAESVADPSSPRPELRPFFPEAGGSVPEIDPKPLSSQKAESVRTFYALPSRSGTKTGHPVLGHWMFPPAYVEHELGADPESLMVLGMIGDAMRPTLLSGDRVVVDTSQNRVSGDGLYVFDDWEGHPQIRRMIHVLAMHPPRLRILADNPLHEDVEIEADKIRIIGRVVARVSRF